MSIRLLDEIKLFHITTLHSISNSFKQKIDILNPISMHFLFLQNSISYKNKNRKTNKKSAQIRPLFCVDATQFNSINTALTSLTFLHYRTARDPRNIQQIQIYIFFYPQSRLHATKF